jgi:hypothetical protein
MIVALICNHSLAFSRLRKAASQKSYDGEEGIGRKIVKLGALTYGFGLTFVSYRKMDR